MIPFRSARMLLSTWPLVLFLIWPPWPSLCGLSVVGGVGVEPPSASNSMSMASSLLQTLADNEFVGDSLSGNDHRGEHGEIINKYRPEECRVKNLKQQQKMSMAKLDAHRCLIRDMVVQVQVPDTLIATYVHPSHIVVPRCTGKIKNKFNFYIFLLYNYDVSVKAELLKSQVCLPYKIKFDN